MTYRQLRKVLQETDDLRLDDDVTIFDVANDEYLPAKTTKNVTEEEQGVLDDGHLVIVI